MKKYTELQAIESSWQVVQQCEPCDDAVTWPFGWSCNSWRDCNLNSNHNHICSMRQMWALASDARLECDLKCVNYPQPCLCDAADMGPSLRCKVWVWPLLHQENITFIFGRLWHLCKDVKTRKDAKDAKMPRLSKVTFLSFQRYFTSFWDGEHLFKDTSHLSEMESIFQRYLRFFQRCWFISIITSLSQE